MRPPEPLTSMRMKDPSFAGEPNGDARGIGNTRDHERTNSLSSAAVRSGCPGSTGTDPGDARS